jgi:hypothetical protein
MLGLRFREKATIRMDQRTPNKLQNSEDTILIWCEARELGKVSPEFMRKRFIDAALVNAFPVEPWHLPSYRSLEVCRSSLGHHSQLISCAAYPAAFRSKVL